MTLVDVQHSQDVTVYVYSLTLSGSYVQAVRGANTGEVLTPLTASDPNFLTNPFPGNKGFKRGYVIQGGAGNSPEIIPGADAFHWLLKLFSAANTQLVAGAYNAAITGDLDILVAFENDPNN
jgi:hypothetical protein